MAHTTITSAPRNKNASRPTHSTAALTPIDAARLLRVGQVAATPASKPAQPPAIETGAKLTRIIAVVRRPEGATVAELMQLTGWLSHSVRGALSGALKRKLGLAVASSVDPDHGRVCGVTEPVEAAPKTSSATSLAPPRAKTARKKQKSDTTGATV